jgi:hypothetical protein
MVGGSLWVLRLAEILLKEVLNTKNQNQSSVLDRGLEPRSGQTKGYKIDICCFSAKHAALRRKSKDWFARNPDNVSEWGDISIRGLISVS